MARLIVIGSVVCLLLGSMVDMARAEEPTKTRDAFFKIGQGIGWMGNRAKDAGGGLADWAKSDSGECDADIAEMTNECLDQWQLLIEAEQLELEGEQDRIGEEWLRRMSE